MSLSNNDIVCIPIGRKHREKGEKGKKRKEIRNSIAEEVFIQCDCAMLRRWRMHGEHSFSSRARETKPVIDHK